MKTSRLVALTAAAALITIACRDSVGPDARPGMLPDPGYGAATVAVLECTVSPGTGDFHCQAPRPAGEGASLAVLGQNQVKMASANVSRDPATGILSADCTLQNLLGEVIGTPDGVTATGSKVFFDAAPTVTAYVSPGDTGTVTVQSG